MIKTYRFYYDLGVPVFDWPTGKKVVSHKFRHTKRNVFAYGLTDAVERLAKAVIVKHGNKATLNLTQAFVSTTCTPRTTHAEDWKEINLDAATIAAFVVGQNSRNLITP